MLYIKCIATMNPLILHRETILLLTSMETYAAHKVYYRQRPFDVAPCETIWFITRHMNTYVVCNVFCRHGPFVTEKLSGLLLEWIHMLYIKCIAVMDPLILLREAGSLLGWERAEHLAFSILFVIIYVVSFYLFPT